MMKLPNCEAATHFKVSLYRYRTAVRVRGNDLVA
jgi:hypothetical protein